MRITLLLATLAATSVCNGQKSKDDVSTNTSTRTIEGRVLTKAGEPVPGAVVLIKDGKTLQVRSYIAQADGRYHFFGLSTDVNYALHAQSQDLVSKDKTVSVFDSHKTVKLDLKLTKPIQEPKAKN